MPSDSDTNKWDWEIGAKTKWWGLSLKEFWSFRHLLTGLVRREFLLNYQQTVLGPVWILVQPILTLFTFILVFGKIVGISTGGIPPALFYLSGIVLWNLFSDSLFGSSNTFRENAHIFSKVYFPRLIMPLSMLTTHFLRFLMQLVLLFLMIAYYWIFEQLPVSVGWHSLLLPLPIALVALIGLSVGLFFSVTTAKYRDLGNLVPLWVRLMMFLTPVIYPLAIVSENIRWIVLWNPLTPLFELFRFALLGEGTFTALQLLYSGLGGVALFLVGLMIFNKQGDKLIDVI
ncbi:ABC transporter permease [soil metagenome]|jgi:lipopolysaccharide transport system permease protein